MKTLYEDKVCKFLSLPSIPKKVWDGKTSFKRGVVALNLITGDKAWAVATYDEDKDKRPRIIKVFSVIPFRLSDDEEYYIVPEYMNVEGIEKWDVDEESKKAAKELAEEAKREEGTTRKDEVTKIEDLPTWIFEGIGTKEEAEAWLRRYNSVNKIKGKVPTNSETLKLRLYAIYCEQQIKK